MTSTSAPPPSPQTGEQPQTIDLAQEDQVDYWTERLGVTREQLEDAVHAAGNSAQAVTEHLLNQGGSAGAS